MAMTEEVAASTERTTRAGTGRHLRWSWLAFLLTCIVPVGRGQYRSEYDFRFDPRGRPYDGRYPYDSRRPGIDLERRIQEDGDSRCAVLQPDHLPIMKSVDTLFGTYEGEQSDTAVGDGSLRKNGL